jgi:hypothetical protein
MSSYFADTTLGGPVVGGYVTATEASSFQFIGFSVIQNCTLTQEGRNRRDGGFDTRRSKSEPED